MRLLEFVTSPFTMRDLVNALSGVFDMERVGGDARIYSVGDRLGIIFLLNNSLKGIGLIWSKGTTRVESVGVWNHIDFNKAPDSIVDIPSDTPLDPLIEPLIKFIRNPVEGIVEGIVLEQARDVSPSEFRKLAQQMFKANANYMSVDDLNKVAKKFSVNIPNGIRHDRSVRVDANHWNLADDETAVVAGKLGTKVGVPDPNDPDYETAVELAKVKTISNMASQGKVMLLGRKANGEVFEIPGIDEITAKIERSLSKQLEAGSGGSSMQQQYDQLEQKVKLVAGGESEFVKSLLVTGMPSAGKTFRIMKVVKSLGLQEGKDYVTKKGRISAKALYRVLIEQVTGLVVFDDCDSVVEDPNGVNMLKGALDTDPVREVSYDVQGLLNTGAMPPEERNRIVSAMSKILRGVATLEEIYVLDPYRGIRQRTVRHYERLQDFLHTDDEGQFRFVSSKWEAEDWDYQNAAMAEANEEANNPSDETMNEVQAWVMDHLPNKIDFQGRIIFISNMRAEQWDSAILTRAFHQDMQFSDAEMFDYIETILQHINTPRLSEEDKVEVLAYLRSLWEEGRITRPVNFRLVQQAFDLRLLNGWRDIIASIG